MFSFPLSLFLIPYALILLMFAFFALVNVTHLVRYGATTGTSFVFTFTFLAGTVVILAASWWGLAAVDWSQAVTIGASASSGLVP